MGMSRSSDRFALGQQVGSYRLIKHLGKGGFADVYLGEHIYLQNQNAIKILRVQLSEDSLQDFLNEAKTIARLDHPNIVRVLDYGVHEETPFLVMGYAPNGSLRTRYPRRTLLPLSQLIPIIQQMASALDYAHQLKLIHRDVKPENMLIGPQQQILLSDFGLAMAATSSTSQASANTAGTVPYMAPEQLQGRVRYSSDQYSLAVTAYEWLCGERPFNGSFTEVASQHVLVPPSSLCDRVPNLPRTVEQVIFKALAKDPTQRFETVQAFAHALQLASQLPSQQFSPRSSLLTNSSTFIQSTPPSTNYASAETDDDFRTVAMNNNFTTPFPSTNTINYPPQATFRLPSPLPPTNTPSSPFTSFPTQQMAPELLAAQSFSADYLSSQYPPSARIAPPQKKQHSFHLWQLLTIITIVLLLITVGITVVNFIHSQDIQSTIYHRHLPSTINVTGLPPNVQSTPISQPVPIEKSGPTSSCLNTIPNHLEFASLPNQKTIFNQKITSSDTIPLHCNNDPAPGPISVQVIAGKNWLFARYDNISSPDPTISGAIRISALQIGLQPGIYSGAVAVSDGISTTIIKVTYTIQ